MKNRVKGLFLAAGLAAVMLCSSVSGAQGAAESAVEAQTEAEGASGAEASENNSGRDYEQLKENAVSTMKGLSDASEAELQEAMESGTAEKAAMAAQWESVRKELGAFQEVTAQEVTEEGKKVTVRSTAVYSDVAPNSEVYVDYTVDFTKTDAPVESIAWDIKYPMGKLMREAGLNTLMGLGIVFAVLVFLSFVISRMGAIVSMTGKKNEPKAAPVKSAPAPAAPAAPAVEEEEDLTDDLELVAVIAAAIAASENTSADGFVVRSIRKVNRRKWQNA